MANYKPVAHAAAQIPQTKLWEDTTAIGPSSSSSADTYGSYVQFSADAGTSKSIYGITVKSTNAVLGGGGTIIDIAEATTVKLRIPLAGFDKHIIFIPLNFKLTDSVQVQVRVKDGEAVANPYEINLCIGAQ